jgi:hypothetical protein
MKDWFRSINASCELPLSSIQSLNDTGFLVISSLIEPDRLTHLSAAYDSAFADASIDDLHLGKTTARLNDFVNRGPEFDELYICQPLLKACSHIIRQPFKLSSMLGRTVYPYAPAQELHIDFKRDEEIFPLVSFIWMIDEFTNDNGATQFLPGSHNWSEIPHDTTTDQLRAEHKIQIVTACGQPGSLIIFAGSVLHGIQQILLSLPAAQYRVRLSRVLRKPRLTFQTACTLEL